MPVLYLLLLVSLFLKSALVVDACRWAIYASKEYEASAEVLFSSSHGLIEQSKAHVKPLLPDICQGLYYDPELLFARNHLENQDGYGLGWYEHGTDGTLSVPLRERSARGATLVGTNATDPGLVELSSRTKSRLLFAHIRAATDGDTKVHNSHPFAYNQLLWMHNGGVPDRKALLKLTDLRCVQLGDLTSGGTDSEAAGAVFGTHLEVGQESICKRSGTFHGDELADAMRQTIADLNNVANESGAHASLNFAASDGKQIVVTRYRTAPKEDPPSLYFLVGEQWDATTETMAGRIQVPFHWTKTIRANTLIVASEPLDRDSLGWRSLAKDQMLKYDIETGELNLSCLSQSCKTDIAHRARRESSTLR